GKGFANPLGTLASAMMMLEQWGETATVKKIQQVWNDILAQGYRTQDLYTPGTDTLVTTQELVELFGDRLTAI
ncbi:MAG: isocitrate/isopropylmalate family dehydrogenase, partial [Cyanobacteria bacterium J06643_13]